MNETTDSSSVPADPPPGGDTGPGTSPGWTPHGQAPGGAPGPVTGVDNFFDGVRRTGIVRSQERWVGGVAGGIALRLGIDPLVTRGILGVSVLLGGLGLVLYAIGWLLLPEQSDGRIHLQQLFRGDFDAAVIGAFAVLIAGISFPDRWAPGMWWGPDAGWWEALGWISAVALVVVVIVSASNRNRQPGSGPGWPGGPGAPGGPGVPGGPGGLAGGTPAPHAPYATPAAAPPRRRAEGPTTTMYPTSTPSATPSAGNQGQHTWGGHGAPHGTSGPWQHGAAAPSGTPGAWHAAPGGPVPAGTPGPVTALPATTRRGAGAGVVGVVVALSLLTLAGLLYADRVGRFDGPVVLTAGAVAVTLLGLAIIVSGLRGRSAGGLGGLAVLLTLVLVPMAAVDRSWDGDWDRSWDGGGAPVGDVDGTPTTVAEAEEGYAIGAGTVRLDLTEVPLDGEDTVTVPIGVGAGDVTVVIPEGTAVDAEVRVMAGEVFWLDEEITRGRGPGTGGDRTYETDAVAAGAEPELSLDITVGAGTVRVEEQP